MRKMRSIILHVLPLAFLSLSLLVSPIDSLGIHPLQFSTDPTTSSTLANAENGILGRRDVLKITFATGIPTLVCPTQARAETFGAFRTSNFNYELGNGECQTSCVRKCDSKADNGECINACVRSGQRYCHETVASKFSPSAKEATTSRYVPTTMEPTIKSSKPIPGLLYNSNRGGAWRD